jgi:OOP family OmpA-OmpF porin
MKFIIATVATALLAATPAFAADDSGFYVGAGIGEFGLELDHSDLIRFDGSDTAFKVLGGYQLMKYFAFELEYIDAGEAEDIWRGEYEGYSVKVTNTIGLSGFNASAVGILPLGEKFSLLGKVGVIYWDADLKEKVYYEEFDNTDSFKDSDSGNDFSWGVGAAFDFTDHVGVRVEYQGFEIEDVDTADLISGSVVWKF